MIKTKIYTINQYKPNVFHNQRSLAHFNIEDSYSYLRHFFNVIICENTELKLKVSYVLRNHIVNLS